MKPSVRVYRGRGGGLPEGVEGTGSGAVRTASGGSPHSRCQPVVVRKRRHVCMRGTPRGRSRHGTSLLSAVIFHSAGQIRLELTAEDIQLDCSCHSVASIRAPPDAFVFAVATRGNTPRSVFFCHFHSCRPPAPSHYFYHRTLRFKTGHVNVLICVVHPSRML